MASVEERPSEALATPTRDSVTRHLKILSAMSAGTITPGHLIDAIRLVDAVRDVEGYADTGEMFLPVGAVDVAPSYIGIEDDDETAYFTIDTGGSIINYSFQRNFKYQETMVTRAQSSFPASTSETDVQLAPYEIRHIVDLIHLGFTGNPPK